MDDRGGARRDLPPALAETHVSWVWLVGDRAYKRLKPVVTDFLDHGTIEARVEAARREVDLNRRMAPDVYLGSADVLEGGHLVDRLIVMRRLDPRDRLSDRVDAPDFEDCLREVARRVAVFHADRSAVDPAPMATATAVAHNWADNHTVLARHAGGVLDADDVARVAELSDRYLSHRGALFDARISAGLVRAGHGDLIADDIFCEADGPRIIDCLAFNDDLRIADVLADIAFLVMDIHRLAGDEAAERLMGWYQEFSNEHHPRSLAHHYIAYRAHVRAKVACLRLEQGDEASAELARAYHDLALHHLGRGRLRLVLVGGGAGVGKSTLARGVGAALGLSVLSTDEIRRELAGVPADEHRFAAPGEGLYDDEHRAAVYEEMLARAGRLIDAGEGVVLDASWTELAEREAARRLARDAGADIDEVECVLDRAVARERIARRLASPHNPSDATPEVVDHLAARRADWPEAVPVGTEAPVAEVVETARRALA